MTALPTSVPAGHEPSDVEFQAMLDILAALSGLPAPTTSNVNGTATSGTTETRDAMLGDYVFTVPAAGATWRYEACFNYVKLNSSVADDLYEIRIRDGGASTPTTSSPLVAALAVPIHTTGGPGQPGVTGRGTWVPGVGTHTLSLFLVRAAGTGIGNEAVGTIPRELYARFVATS